MRLLVVALTAVVAAGEPAWDSLPHAADDDRPCELHLASPEGWQVAQPADARTRISDGQLHITVQPRQDGLVRCVGPGGLAMQVLLLAPGQAQQLSTDAAGMLRSGSDAVILAVPRREAAADRRWGFLRLFTPQAPSICELVIEEPTQIAWGTPALTRQVATAQTYDVRGKAVLVRLSGQDRFAGWKHREYRQTLAWLMADLAARGAIRVVLVEPYAPTADAALLAPLREQVRDVAQAYRCPVVATSELDQHALWESAPGILGQQLNQAGQTRLGQLLRSWIP